MAHSLAKQVSDAVVFLGSSSATGVAAALNETINRFVGGPFHAVAGLAVDASGTKTATFGTLIYIAPAELVSNPVEAQADTVGCVISVSHSIDIDRFRQAYSEVAGAKRLKKSAVPIKNGVPHTTTTLGIVFATTSSVPLEVLAEELDRLNQQMPSPQWPDMLVVLSQGIVNYAVQFPGEGVSGDFLPPAQGAIKSYIPPFYVVLVMKPSDEFTLNKMLSFLVLHLSIFSPGTALPNWKDMQDGASQTAITLSGYQYNLRGDLLPVPRAFYKDRYLPPLPIRIEDPFGKLPSTIQFLPWQDGGVVLLSGKLPIEGLLMFAGPEALRNGVIKHGERQSSYVIPMTQTSYDTFLRTIQQRSNLILRPAPAKFITQKIADEGASSPFMARMYIGIMTLRDVVFPEPQKRGEFDTIFDTLITGLQNLRITSRDVATLLSDHKKKISSGEIARVNGQSIQINESITLELRKHTEDFLNGGVRIIKQSMQSLTKLLQADIGFLFQKSVPFSQSVTALRATDPNFADYLTQTRAWSERLIDSRNAIEHSGWQLPAVTYSLDKGSIVVQEPQVSGQPVSDFAVPMLDRILCFAEEVTAHCLQQRMPQGISLTEIPIRDRSPEMPVRFEITVSTGGRPLWHIAYHQSPFDKT
jgi:hypothetical protein